MENPINGFLNNVARAVRGIIGDRSCWSAEEYGTDLLNKSTAAPSRWVRRQSRLGRTSDWMPPVRQQGDSTFVARRWTGINFKYWHGAVNYTNMRQNIL
jgi:hypothetical protein